MTVNGKKDWHMVLASPDSKIFKMGAVICSKSMPMTLRRSLEAVEKRQADTACWKTETLSERRQNYGEEN